MLHIFYTRFNVSIPEWKVSVDESWLEKRLCIFESVTVNSMWSQSCGNFAWFILLDSESPSWLRERMSLLKSLDSRFHPLYYQHSRLDFRSHIAPSTQDVVITTRLDSDDALAFDFVETVQQECRGVRELINFDVGIVIRDGKIFEKYSASNQFLSLIEVDPPFLTINSTGQHHTASHVAPIRGLVTEPMWLWYNHGLNASSISNPEGYASAVSGKLLSKEVVRSRFPKCILPEISS